LIGKSLVMAAAATAAAGTIVAPSAASAQTAPVSTIYSAALNTCMDTSLISPEPYTNVSYVYGGPCDGAPAQQFTLQAQSAAGTYEFISAASGQCVTDYGDYLSTTHCTGSIPPDRDSDAFTLVPAGTSGQEYQIELTVTINPLGTPSCIQVFPQSSGAPGPVYKLRQCDATNADQIFTLSTTP